MAMWIISIIEDALAGHRINFLEDRLFYLYINFLSDEHQKKFVVFVAKDELYIREYD